MVHIYDSLKYFFRYILTLCLIAAIAFMVACTVLVIVLIANGAIKIHRIEEDEKEVVEK